MLRMVQSNARWNLTCKALIRENFCLLLWTNQMRRLYFLRLYFKESVNFVFCQFYKDVEEEEERKREGKEEERREKRMAKEWRRGEGRERK